MEACFKILGEMNYLAILTATFITMILGALWYSPLLFGNQWMKLMGFTAEQLKKEGSAKEMMISVITSFVEAVVLASLIIMTGADTLFRGIHLGLMIGIGFIAMVTLSNAMFNKTPIQVWLMGAGYRVLYFMINGALLTAWK